MMKISPTEVLRIAYKSLAIAGGVGEYIDGRLTDEYPGRRTERGAHMLRQIARVDDKTKLSAWKDELAGRPSPKQQKKAERRVAELEAEAPKGP